MDENYGSGYCTWPRIEPDNPPIAERIFGENITATAISAAAITAKIITYSIEL